MTDIKDATIDELKRTLKLKEAEAEKAVLEGVLKHDLYMMSGAWDTAIQELAPGNIRYTPYITKEYLDQIRAKIDEFLLNRLVVRKGTRFVAFQYEDNANYWFDGIGFGKDDEWAKEHLENIRPIQQ